MGLIVSITAWILGAGSDIIALARRVIDGIAQLWNTLIAYFTNIALAAGRVAGGGLALGASLVRLGIALATQLPYLIFVYVPRLVGSAVSQVVSWTLQYIAGVAADLRQLANDVLSWAQSKVAELLRDLADLKNWALGQLADIRNTLSWVFGKVTALLTDPTILAQWLLVPLFGVARQWAQDNATAVARWALGIAVTGTIKAAGIIEDIIVSIF